MSSKQVRQAILTGPGNIAIVRRERPALGRDDIRIGVEQCGVSDSEVWLWTGETRARGAVELGREIAGRVIEVARDVRGFEVGDRVAAWAPSGRGMADEAVVKAVHCVKITDRVRCPAAVHSLARVVNTIHSAAVPMTASATVLGAGYIGGLAVQLAEGARTVLLARSELERDVLARSTQRVPIATLRDVGSVVEQVAKGERSEVVYEFTGMQAGLEQATRVVRPGGKLVIGGLHQGLAIPDPGAILGPGWRVLELERLNRMAVDIVNAHTRDPQVIGRARRRARTLLAEGVVDGAAVGASTSSSDDIAEMLASAVITVDKAVMNPHADTVVIGSDPRALLTLMLIKAKRDPRSLILVTPEPKVADLGRALGATRFVHPGLRTALGEITRRGDGANHVYEFTGTQKGLDLATRVLRTHGTLVIAGLHQGPPTPDGRWVLKPGQRVLDIERLQRMGVDLVNAHLRDPGAIVQGMQRAAELLHDRVVDPRMLAASPVALDEAQAAFELAAEGIFKVFVEP